MKTFLDFGIQLPASAHGEIDVTCPQCSHTRKKKHARCLGVNVDKGTWLCQHCGWSGGLQQGSRTNELHWQKPIFVRPVAFDPPEDIDQAMVDWFANRGITHSVLRRNKICTRTVYMPQVEDRVGAICFPYYRGAELINAKYRDREKNFRMEAGAERILYGLNDINPKRVVIVEGEIDKLSVEVAGIISCVSVPDGAPAISAKNYASKFTYLDTAQEQIEAVEEWIIAVDNDPPGTRLEEELVRRFGVGKCKRVKWPEGCKDANDVLVKLGADELKHCIDRAEEFPIKGVIYLNQLRKEIELLYEQNESRGVSTGWPGFDRYYTVQPGELTVVTGTPGSGKSNWLDSLCVNLARDHHWITAMFSPENQPLAKHYARLMQKFVREPFRLGQAPRMSPQRRDEAFEWCDFYFPMIHPEDEADWTLEKIFEIGAQLVRRLGIKGMVIDPWNEIEHNRPLNMTESEFVGRELRKIRGFARRHLVHVWLVAHPRIMYRTKDGKVPMPTLYDIAGSANFYNKPDNGIVIFRDKTNREAPIEAHVQKIRLPETGDIGFQKFKFNKSLADYEEVEEERVGDLWGGGD